ncbi:MAG: guanylate kinase [Maricaulis sp.]|jgi:guanylate kinase|uniref:guanylate kinase n=1 Tax=Maricaulis sp. TaxID=1486257 RepID=UPI001B0C837D|nr:guanylate kinase [Maricaulis sp.]MBO6728306.1 guanylate kinase [Maricaulis sp.]MBO6847875.1 guanylate kinase [Maricaulis sp.]MBO6877498.1 guanylate kinase [Maricaulis sp.]MDM7983566.1 guanylate kinase [Maricaulis sp.]
MSSDGFSGTIFRGRRRGVLIALSSPSGAGKTTLSKRLLSQNPDVVLSISCTTRKPRPGEINGQDYDFISVEEFKKRIDDGYFFEWAEVFGRYYGTPKTPVMEAIDEGRDVIFDIDWQGAQIIADQAPEDTVRIFILPPSLALLEDRLRKRGQDSDEVIRDRMNRAKDEISHWDEYDYVIVNDDFARALEKLNQALHAERLKRNRHPWLGEFVDALMEQ